MKLQVQQINELNFVNAKIMNRDKKCDKCKNSCLRK